MRQRFRASVAGLVLCVLPAFLAACSEPSAQIPVQEIAEEASVPLLTARTEGTDVEVAGTWSTDGLDVTYLVFPGVYQQLGGGAFYCYPDAAHYGDGVYYQYDWTADQITEFEVETVEETTAAGQVRFRWWRTAGGLGIHNISDQQLRNDYTLDTSLAYASAIAGDTARVLLEQGGGTEHQAFYLLDLHTKAVEPLPTGTDAPLRKAVWNGTATRVLLRLRDGGFYLGDGSDAASLQERMQLDAPIVRAQWLGADQPDRLLCITQADSARCSAWVYDCAAETTTLLLEDYAEYMGNNDETTQYELLSDAYALRRDPDGSAWLVDLAQKTERRLSDFSWDAGVFSGMTRDTARYVARGASDMTALGCLDCKGGVFQWFRRSPNPAQTEEFDLLFLHDRVFGIAARPDGLEGPPCFLYVYRFSGQAAS